MLINDTLPRVKPTSSFSNITTTNG
jgi:hypothetical protein